MNHNTSASATGSQSSKKSSLNPYALAGKIHAWIASLELKGKRDFILNQRRVLHYLHAVAAGKNYAYPSLGTVADHLQLSEKTIMRCYVALREKNLIYRDHRRKSGVFLNVPKDELVMGEILSSDSEAEDPGIAFAEAKLKESQEKDQDTFSEICPDRRTDSLEICPEDQDTFSRKSVPRINRINKNEDFGSRVDRNFNDSGAPKVSQVELAKPSSAEDLKREKEAKKESQKTVSKWRYEIHEEFGAVKICRATGTIFSCENGKELGITFPDDADEEKASPKNNKPSGRGSVMRDQINQRLNEVRPESEAQHLTDLDRSSSSNTEDGFVDEVIDQSISGGGDGSPSSGKPVMVPKEEKEKENDVSYNQPDLFS